MDKLLLKYGVSPETTALGEGVEAIVYPLQEHRVLRIFKSNHLPSSAKLKLLKDFYDTLDRTNVDFDVPEILSISDNQSDVYTIDKKLRGENLHLSYGKLDAASKRKTIDSYLKAATEIQQLHSAYSYFGEILADHPIREGTWAAFLERKIESAYEQGRPHFDEDLPEAASVVALMKKSLAVCRDVAEARLVHGDYYFPNVLVDQCDVTAVLDFNDLTLAGDCRMDLASAVIYLDQVEPESSALSRKAFIDDIAKQFGADIKDVIELYELYYAFVFASYTKKTDSNAYQWALTTLKRFCKKYQLRR